MLVVVAVVITGAAAVIVGAIVGLIWHYYMRNKPISSTRMPSSASCSENTSFKSDDTECSASLPNLDVQGLATLAKGM